MKAKFSVLMLAAVFSASTSVCASDPEAEAIVRPTTDFTKLEEYEVNSAGASTSYKAPDGNAFSQFSANLAFHRQLDFKVGDGIFRKLWVSAPSSTVSSDGLGPLFNARSCQSCHLKDGRGRPPVGDETAISMFLRLSVPPRTDKEKADIASHRLAVVPEPTYGTQLQNFSIQGLLAEGRMDIKYEEIPVTLADGAVVSLRKPTYRAVDLNYGPMDKEAMLSPRIAPPMIGMGLLEAITEKDILAWADPDDKNGDGIRGRAAMVWDPEKGKPVVGRFGWKGGAHSVADQTAHAFAGDIGLSSALVPQAHGDCTEKQSKCRAMPDGRDPDEGVEVPKKMFDLVVFYSRNLAVPARRNADHSDVLAGKRVFYRSGCIACHRPKFVTREDSAEPEQSYQLIWPYTDLLLHDMGEGLSDGRPEGVAGARDWRTAPLWGVGLTKTVSGEWALLHDGRARSLLEAILWHGGEAEAAKQNVVRLSKKDRDTLIKFLESL